MIPDARPVYHSPPPEEWRPVPRYEMYEVSNLGRVRRTIYLKHFGSKDGRLRVFLGGTRPDASSFLVHQIVAAAFHGPCPGGHQVNHIDGDHQNNRAENLEYLTPTENMKHAYRLGLIRAPDNRGERNGQAKLTERQVLAIRELAATRTLSYCQIGERFGVGDHAVGDIVRRTNWRHI